MAKLTVRIERVALGLVTAVLLMAGVAQAAAETVESDLLKRSRARPEGTSNIGVYVESRSEYREQWERFGFRSDRPGVDFDRRRVVFVATTESSSCPQKFRRVAL